MQWNLTNTEMERQSGFKLQSSQSLSGLCSSECAFYLWFCVNGIWVVVDAAKRVQTSFFKERQNWQFLEMQTQIQENEMLKGGLLEMYSVLAEIYQL